MNKCEIKFQKSLTAVFAGVILCGLLSSCSTKHTEPADPELVAAFQNVDATLSEIAAAQASDFGMKDRASGALEEFARVLGLQVSTYPNPKQASECKNLMMEIAEFSARAYNMGDDPGPDARMEFYNEWLAFRPRLKQFVGAAADAQPGQQQPVQQ